MTTTEEPWTIGRLLSWTVDYLGRHGSENPRLDAEVLLAAARGCKRIELYTAYGEVADEAVRTAFRELVKRRAEGTPVAYLVGHREFYSLDFEVNSDVLIPRPETELLVVALLDDIKAKTTGHSFSTSGNESPTATLDPQATAPVSIVDVGTGSGILAICAAKYVLHAQVTAIDISQAALTVAKRNAERHGVVDRITFVNGDLLSETTELPQFDYVLSNPPYISTAEMEQLPRDVRQYEPEVALRAGEKGTDVVAPLIAQAAPRLKPGGVLFIEVSPMIADEVDALIRQQVSLEAGAIMRDLAGHARVVQATKR